MSSAAEADDPRDRWADAFSIPYRQFVDDFRAHLKAVGRPAPGSTVEPKPVP